MMLIDRPAGHQKYLRAKLHPNTPHGVLSIAHKGPLALSAHVLRLMLYPDTVPLTKRLVVPPQGVVC
jgi:hypothetical protein